MRSTSVLRSLTLVTLAAMLVFYEDYAKPPESAAGSPCPKRIKTGRHAVQITGNGFSGR